jgi:hypothetical protein
MGSQSEKSGSRPPSEFAHRPARFGRLAPSRALSRLLGDAMDNDITALQVLFTETYYWVTIVFMFFIHVGFCTYEVGVARRKNHLATLM